MQRIQCKITKPNSSVTINDEGKEHRAFVSGKSIKDLSIVTLNRRIDCAKCPQMAISVLLS